jgi:hypothetical protein
MRLVLILLGLLLVQPVWAGWRRIDIASDNSFAIYIDYATLRKTDKGRRMWTLFDYETPQQPIKDEPEFKSEKVLYEFDCANDQLRSLTMVGYAEEMGAGDTTHQVNRPGKWVYSVPQSMSASLMKAACKHPIK